MLQDRFGRIHDYLRISLTDACNFRCTYCMPQDIHFMPHNRLMSVDEIEQIATEFVKLGVNKIRLTGGEPLVRKDAKEIIKRLSRLPVTLTLTTNGLLLHEYIDDILQANIKSINVSIDSLKEDKFEIITRRNCLKNVIQNIHILLQHDISVKLNIVCIKGFNDDEICDFVALTKQLPLHVRFIEFMPFTGNDWSPDTVVSAETILHLVSEQFTFVKLKDEFNDTARKYKPLHHEGTFAIISTITNPFCGGCNRLRLTADGKMKNCLFSKNETDLLSALRSGDDFTTLIIDNLYSKAKERGGQFSTSYQDLDALHIINRSMVNIGG